MRFYLASRPLPPLPRQEARRNAFFAARALLTALLDRVGVPQDVADVETTPEGRPFFPHCPHVDFSISHTDGAAFCLLALADKGDAAPRVGLDAELPLPQEKAARLAARFFAPEERRLFEKNSGTPTAFLEIFTGKEAFAKYDGRGLAKTLKIDTVCPLFAQNYHVALRRLTLLDHIVTLCLPQKAAEVEIVFFEL